MDTKPCLCGHSMTLSGIDVGRRFCCERCQAQDFERQSFELDAEQLGSSSPLEYLARRERGLRDETVELVASSSAASTAGLPGATQRQAPGVGSDSSRIGQGLLTEDASLGKYQLRRLLGQGGMGYVYEAYDPDLQRCVALKVLNRQMCENPRFIERFKREAQSAASLSHPNITHVYSCGEEQGNYFFAMELVDGRDLAELLGDRGSLPFGECLDLLTQSARALQAAKAKQIIHRDIKPSNLLITEQGQVKVTDFGLAKAVMGSAIELTTTGVVMGTPLYMSPEQGKATEVDHRSDIYSLGATFYHLAVGAPPFEADGALAIILKHVNEPLTFPADCTVSTALRVVLRRMMEKSPDRRYGDYDELIADLDRVRAGEKVERQGERGEPEVVVLNYRRSAARGSSLFRVGKLSLARTNLKLGRRGKAVSILEEMLASESDKALRAEAGLILLDLYDREQDVTRARRAAQMVARTELEGASDYGLWKLARYANQEALDATRAALASHQSLLQRVGSDQRALVEGQIERLERRINQSVEELAGFHVVLVED